jgi:propionate CoA-transferase
MELYAGCIVNIGLGIGAGIPAVVEYEGFLDKITFTLELGSFGGIPTKLPDFGAVIDPASYVSHPTMFDYYHTGSLDVAFLGTAEIDKAGNVNVSKMGGRNAGQGGFIDISQTSKKTVFTSFFTTKGMKVSITDGRLAIEQDGAIQKLVEQVSQITYNGKIAAEDGRKAIYVTERAVFELTKDGILLIEIAPGIDLEKDILGRMGFRPLISSKLRLMDERIFRPGRIGMFD